MYGLLAFMLSSFFTATQKVSIYKSSNYVPLSWAEIASGVAQTP